MVVKASEWEIDGTSAIIKLDLFLNGILSIALIGALNRNFTSPQQ